MYIRKLSLRNFRNYLIQTVNFGNNFNVIYGDNAQGKTNILESIFICTCGRSHRTSRDNELVKIGQKNFYISLEFERSDGSPEIEILYKKGERKRIKINDIPIKKMGELIGNLNSIIFSPEDLMVVKEGPSLRRRFIDITMSQLKKTYFYEIQQYSRILNQRNCLLKESADKKALENSIDVWDTQLAESGAKIMIERFKFIKRLEKYTCIKHKLLSEGKEELRLDYKSSIKIDEDTAPDDLFKRYLKKIKEDFEKERIRRTTISGPHRDDIDIILNGEKVKSYGSQGQQRTAVLSMKLSEIDIMKEETEETPVLLLDDVMSELDEKRQRFILEGLDQVQAFITTTSADMFLNTANKKDIKYLQVVDGKIIE